jgi:hypothetical protein
MEASMSTFSPSHGPGTAATTSDTSGQPKLTVVPWVDPVVDDIGHDPRSPYVERYWLGLLGPSTTWLLRMFADRLDDDPAGFQLDTDEMARVLGIGDRPGSDGPFQRSLARCCRFGLAQPLDPGVRDPRHGATRLAVRRRLPPLSAHQLRRLPPSLQASHRLWEARRPAGPDTERMKDRARRIALTLLDAGDDAPTCEHQLREWGFHPALGHDAVRWAVERTRHGGPPAA